MAKRHDHRQSVWVMVLSPPLPSVLWCYRCGALRVNKKGRHWHKPVGLDGENPAMRKGWKP